MPRRPAPCGPPNVEKLAVCGDDRDIERVRARLPATDPEAAVDEFFRRSEELGVFRQVPVRVVAPPPSRDRIRHELEQAVHDFFYERGFIRCDTPLLTAAIGERAGLSLAALEPGWSRARARGLMRNDPDHLQATELGLRFLNDLLQEFMPEADEV